MSPSTIFAIPGVITPSVVVFSVLPDVSVISASLCPSTAPVNSAMSTEFSISPFTATVCLRAVTVTDFFIILAVVLV